MKLSRNDFGIKQGIGIMGFDFANILFAGRCNRFCPFCIGKEIDNRLSPDNLENFPPANFYKFLDEIKRLGIREVVFTGTTTDPQLYRYEEELIHEIRSNLPEVNISVHTNGVLALHKMKIFNQYDRACISFPSFKPETYRKMMGSARVPDLGEIVKQSEIPIKVSCIINECNIDELDEFTRRLREIGIKRAVLRKLFAETRNWRILADQKPVRYYRNNPVYDLNGMELTYWDFDVTESRSINLFPDGTISSSYLLVRAPV